MIKKKLLILCLFFYQFTFCQTSIGLEIGLDYSDFRSASFDDDQYAFLWENEDKDSSIKYSILGEHQLKNKWFSNGKIIT